MGYGLQAVSLPSGWNTKPRTLNYKHYTLNKLKKKGQSTQGYIHRPLSFYHLTAEHALRCITSLHDQRMSRRECQPQRTRPR